MKRTALVTWKSKCFPEKKRHLPSDKTTSVFQFWASLSPAAATVAPSSPRHSRHLTCLCYSGQREGDLSSLNPSLLLLQLCHQPERVSRCVWPLRMPVMLLTLSYHLWTCTKSHTNSVTVCVTGLTSRTEMLWRHCLHQFDLDTPFIQAKVKSKVTGPWYCIMMTTTTSLSMETEVQEKNQDILSIFYFLLWKNQFPAPMFR